MASFHCDNAYWVMHQDLVVLSGYLLSGKVLPGWAVDLPREIKGPGWVPIRDVQMVDFAGKRKLCIVLDYDVLDGAQLMEFSDLEGRALDVRPV